MGLEQLIPLIVPAATGFSLVKSLTDKPEKLDIPGVRAESTSPAKTAKRIEPVSELDKRNKRRAASIFTSEGFVTPKLAKPGLLGLGV